MPWLLLPAPLGEVEQKPPSPSLGFSPWRATTATPHTLRSRVAHKASLPPPLNLPAVVDWIHDITWGAWLALCLATLLAVWSLVNYMSNIWHFFRYIMVEEGGAKAH
jgi:hypothetical protein